MDRAGCNKTHPWHTHPHLKEEPHGNLRMVYMVVSTSKLGGDPLTYKRPRTALVSVTDFHTYRYNICLGCIRYINA